MMKNGGLTKFTMYVSGGVLYLLLWLFTDITNHPGKFIPLLVNSIWLSVYIVVANFIFFDQALPLIKRKAKHILSSIAFLMLCVFALFVLLTFGLYAWRSVGLLLHVYTVLKLFTSQGEIIFYLSPQGLLSILFFGIISHLNNHVQLKHAAQQLRIEKQDAELNYLRSQTNPHFLFNTLNNIYSLSRDKSDLAPESILRLSKILRYMLYETGGDYNSIEAELQVISDYIALEKLRYDDSLQITFTHDTGNTHTVLPPLLLIPLVENAFKHGAAETRDNPFIDIDLTIRQDQLVFTVKNSTEARQADGKVKENIGLSNLRRQLELLYTVYQLSAVQSEKTFIVTLQINLASHV